MAIVPLPQKIILVRVAGEQITTTAKCAVVCFLRVLYVPGLR